MVMRKLKRNKRHYNMSRIKLFLLILLMCGMLMHSEGFFKSLFKGIAKSVTGMIKHVGSTIKAVAKGDITAITQLTPMALQAKAASTILENVGGTLPPPMNQAASMASNIAKVNANMAGGAGLKMAIGGGPMAAMRGLQGLPIPGMNGLTEQPGIGFPIPGPQQGIRMPSMMGMTGNLLFRPPSQLPYPQPQQLKYPSLPPLSQYPTQAQLPQYTANSPFQQPYPMLMPAY